MRKAGESIHIGPNIVVTLVALERNRARIGISAPRNVTVDREEIAKKKQLDALRQAGLLGQSPTDDEEHQAIEIELPEPDENDPQ